MWIWLYLTSNLIKIIVRKECLDLDFHFAGSYAGAYICENLKMGAGEVTR